MSALPKPGVSIFTNAYFKYLCTYHDNYSFSSESWANNPQQIRSPAQPHRDYRPSCIFRTYTVNITFILKSPGLYFPATSEDKP
jgi:hypothetical protein